jgi:hypothetical protein
MVIRQASRSHVLLSNGAPQFVHAFGADAICRPSSSSLSCAPFLVFLIPLRSAFFLSDTITSWYNLETVTETLEKFTNLR